MGFRPTSLYSNPISEQAVVLGHMDFEVAGSVNAVTAFRMNFKALSFLHHTLAAHPAPEQAAALSDLQLHIAKVPLTMLRAGGPRGA
jgi:polyribonucleotide nucleotidyltransferase